MANPFQPKFVDLVRNYSTTVGTGNFVLGPAVNGHSSLATALTIGDEFYYSAIGVDKPAEREVGRGQLLADGTVSRTPVSGPKTSFTTGNKTIALIAAAEWFTAIQAGGSGTQAAEAGASAEQAATSAGEASASSTSANSASTAAQAAQVAAETAKAGAETAKAGAETAKAGADQAQSGAQLAEAGAQQAEAGAEAARDAAIAAGGGGQSAVASRAALAATTSTTEPVYLTEAGREGMFVWTATNQSANVTLDTYQGIYVAPSSDTTGASGAWVRQYDGALELKWFGFADGATTNAARVESAAALLGTRGGVLRSPPGSVALDRDPVIDARCITLEGHGPGNITSIASASSLWTTPAGYNGISFLHTGGSAGAQRSAVRDIAFYQPAALATTAVADHTAGANTITVTSGANDYASGQVIALEGAGPSYTMIGKTAAITSGSSVATITSEAGNPGVYAGQHIDIAGAGLPAGTTVVSMTSTTITLSAAATATVSGAAITVKYPLVSRVASVAGPTVTLTQTPSGDQSVTGGVLKHRSAAIYGSCTLDGDRVMAAGYDLGLFLHGETTGNAIADTGAFRSCAIFGSWADVVCQGADANINTFHNCLFGNGSKIAFLDMSLIGNHLFGCHFAFNVGIAVPRASATTKLFGCYFEGGTSYLGNNGGTDAFGCVGMRPVCGWRHWGSNDAVSTYGNVPSIVARDFVQIVDADGVASGGLVVKGPVKLSSANYRMRVENGSAGVPFGAAGVGLELYQDGSRVWHQAYNRTSSAYVPLRVAGSQIEFAPSGTVAATVTATGLSVTGTVAATGAVSGSNLSGTNTGDQFTAMTTARLLGRTTAGTGVAEQLTAAQAKTMLAIAAADVSGLATVATSGSGGDLIAGSVTYAKLQNASASRLIGNAAGAAGVPGEVGLGANLGFSGSNIQVQLAASAKLLGRTTAGAGATEEIGVANGITLAAGALGLGALTPASVAATGAITSTGGGVGYATGAGGAVTQLTNKATSVTLNKLSGAITMHAASMAASAIIEFTVNNSQIVVGDTVNLNLASGAANGINYRYWVSAVGSGLFKIAVENRSAGALGEALVLNFAAFKAVSA